MKAAAIIVAAGSGKRFGLPVPKQFLKLKGLPVFLWSILSFKKIKEFKHIIVVIPDRWISTLKKYQKKYDIEFAAGGKERFNSVRSGLKRLRNDIEYVSIHDAARPLVTPALIRRGLEAAVKYGSSVTAFASFDTVKLSGQNLFVSRTVPRNTVWLAQTPQTFRRDIIEEAYKKLRFQHITDDAQAVEKLGKKVKIVPGDYRNIKITDKKDLELVKIFLKDSK